MSEMYEPFGVHTAAGFDKVIFNHHHATSSPMVSNFSRRISVRPALSSTPSSGEPRTAFAIPDMSRASSFGSSKCSGPLTPGRELRLSQCLAGPIITPSDCDSYSDAENPAFTIEPERPSKLNLSFEIDRTITQIEAGARPPQLLERLSTHHRNSRPSTGAPFTDLRPVTLQKDIRQEKPRTTTSNVTSFTDFKQALAERQEQARRVEASNVSPVSPGLQFLQHDPFRCLPTATTNAQSRPKSAGADTMISVEEVSELAFNRRTLKKTKSLQSILSGKSTESLKRGISRMKRVLSTSRKAT